MTMPLAPSLLLLLILSVSATGGVYPGFLVPTDVTCVTTADCFAHYNNAWCHRGLLCLQTRCYAAPNFPCPRTEWCDEREQRCIRRNCTSWRDCDDGVYCNGEELCVAGQCVVDPSFDCTQGGYICDEARRHCSQPLSLGAERVRLAQQNSRVQAQSAQEHFHIANTTNSSNSTVPVGEISTATLIWVVVGLAGFLFLVMIFWLIQQAAARRPQAIMIDRDARNGDRLFAPETYY